ncbi:MAG: hypothetical protein L0L48_08245 [Lactobacillus sp.]|nr:hypothetical protein [Lactobacillus sp.]
MKKIKLIFLILLSCLTITIIQPIFSNTPSNITVYAKAKYPTHWTKATPYCTYKSTRVKHAVKKSIEAAIIGTITGHVGKKAMLSYVVSGIVDYCDQKTDVRTYTTYYYRELGKGHTDPNSGEFFGNYQMKKKITVYLFKKHHHRRKMGKTRTFYTKTPDLYAF